MRLWRASSTRSRPNWSCTATTRHATMRGSACSITWKCFTTGSDGTHRLATRPRYRSRRSNRLVRCPPFVGKIILSVDFRNALLDLSTWRGVRRTWYEVLRATTDERRAECEALGNECEVLTTAYFVRRDDC